jgi:hypothetical protein
MENNKIEKSSYLPLHFWRIHSKVARRIWGDLPDNIRDVIADDSLHTTEEFKWFDNKTMEDSMRLFMDPSYYDNESFTFKNSNYSF